MKTISKALLPLALLSSISFAQGEAIPAPTACTQAVDSLANTPAQHRVSQSSVTRAAPSQNQVYWINSRGDGSSAELRFKSKCVTGIEGQVVSLRVEQGYWK